jgi:hypothetical protein
LRPSRKDLLTWIQRLLGVTPAPSRRELQRQRQFAIDEARWQAWWAARKRGVKYDDCSAAAAQDLAGTEAAGSADRVFKSYKLIQRRRRVGSPTGSKGRP